MLPVAVLAGGLGTRMADVTGPTIPKALLRVAGRPFIDFKLAGLAAEGVERVALLVGHGDRLIADHVGTGAQYGLHVTCRSDGPILLGTGGAVREALDLLGEAFWVTYGDTYLRAPMEEIETSFRSQNVEGMLTVLRNRDRWDRSNVRIDEALVVEHRKGSRQGSYEYIDYGLAILRRDSVKSFPAGSPFDLEDVFQRLITSGTLGAHVVARRFYEIGSPEGYRQTDEYLRASGEWKRLVERRVSAERPG
jgi:N-acetyl-alpha-D-muramate 1-phosphate uridylyltransferase